MECKERYYLVEVQVADADVIPVLGLQSSTELKLIKSLQTIESDNAQGPEKIMKDYEHLFKGIGTLPGQNEIKMDEHACPTIHPPRRIPHMLKDKVKDEQKRMERMGIITKVEQPTKWVNPIVVVKKPNGDVRICLDSVKLNKSIQREHYPLKTVEKVAASLGDAKIFTTLDVTSGFYQIKLAEKSTWLTTFNTPFGRYKFERLPFGIVSAPEVFQRTMAQMFEDIEGCEVFVDDLLVWGKSEQEHNERLKNVMERAAEIDLKFNKEKCKINQKEVKYVGHTFGSDGLKPSVDRVQAILDMPLPQDRKSLQRFMGMVNYLNKFIPNLSSVSKPLRELLNHSEWHWIKKQQEAYDILISLIVQLPVLKYFDINAAVTVSVDAYSEGLGACLLQGNQPVAHASRALNNDEKNYAQIEKEMLAIVYGTNKFHQYIYGKIVIVETDHKPLESLFKKPLCKAPQRIQRMMLRVQHYDFTVKYSPGNTLYIADTLSRASQSGESEQGNDEFEVHLLVPISKENVEEFKKETESDVLLSKLKEVVLAGWPEKISEVEPDLQIYWNFREELCICDGLLLKGYRLITPSSLRTEMLDKIHSSHLGTKKCLN